MGLFVLQAIVGLRETNAAKANAGRCVRDDDCLESPVGTKLLRQGRVFVSPASLNSTEVSLSCVLQGNQGLRAGSANMFELFFALSFSKSCRGI